MNKHEALRKIEILEFEKEELIKEKEHIVGEFARLKNAYKGLEKLNSSLRTEYRELRDSI